LLNLLSHGRKIFGRKFTDSIDFVLMKKEAPRISAKHDTIGISAEDPVICSSAFFPLKCQQYSGDRFRLPMS
jgi:hypothetical protein